MIRTIGTLSLLAFLLSLMEPNSLAAAEGASGLWPMGYGSAKAGIQPPPGTLALRNDIYHNHSHLKGAARVKVSLDAPAFRYVTDVKILGGDYGFGAIFQAGRVNVHAKQVQNVTSVQNLPGPNGVPQPTVVVTPVTKKIHRVAHGVGDTYVAPFILGWHTETLHTLFIQAAWVPTGKYSKDHVANMGRNRWATDTDFAFTWLDPKYGLEVSALTGVTVNFTNHKTHYRSGSEWHTDFFIGKNLTKALEVGLVGYWYYQLTPDKGKGATFGDFRGRVLGLGPYLGYTFTIGKTPIYANARYYHDSHVKNHLKGDTFYFTLVAFF